METDKLYLEIRMLVATIGKMTMHALEQRLNSEATVRVARRVTCCGPSDTWVATAG